jgi:hypothetical protein
MSNEKDGLKKFPKIPQSVTVGAVHAHGPGKIFGRLLFH